MGLEYKDIVLKHKQCIVRNRSECDITVRFGRQRYNSPVIPANMPAIINSETARIFDNRGWLYVYHRICPISDIKDFIKHAQSFKTVSISVGIQPEYLDLISWIKTERLRVDVFTIDLALSFTDAISPVVNKIKSLFPDSFLIVGNGYVPEWIEFLENIGVDAAKINVGVSNVCRTYQYTGFRSFTVSSLLECREAAKNIKLIADGGLTVDPVTHEVSVGDVAKALCVGAHYVMSGSLFVKATDSPAQKSGYYGNASVKAKGARKHVEGALYFPPIAEITLEQTLTWIEESLKSSVSYGGGKYLYDLRNVSWELV